MSNKTINLVDHVKVEDRVAKTTVGDELKKRYLESLDPDKKLDYKAKAKQYFDNAVKEIQNNIDNGKAPVYIASSDKTSRGIIATDDSMVELFQDFAFNLICRDMAEEYGLVVDFSVQPVIRPHNPSEPVINMAMVITLK